MKNAKVGDRVCSRSNPTEIGTIIEVCGTSNVLVAFDKANDQYHSANKRYPNKCWYMHQQALNKINKTSKKEKTVPADSIKVGDKVRVLDTGLGQTEAKVGDILIVKNVWSGGGVIDTVRSDEKYSYIWSSYQLEKVVQKHHYTDREIREAKIYILEIITTVGGTWDIESWSKVNYGDVIESEGYGKKAYAKCSPNDEWNFWIGKMVSLCKLFGYNLPDFVK